MNKPAWGIDLGGTKIEGVIMPAADHPDPLVRMRIDTEAHKGYDHTLHQIGTLVQMMKDKSGLTPFQIGFATPGVIDPKLQGMKNCNSTHLNGKPLKRDLEQKTRCARNTRQRRKLFCPGGNKMGDRKKRNA